MKISILCSDRSHPIYRVLECWRAEHEGTDDVELVEESRLLGGGEILFLISCTEIVGRDIRSRYRASLVIHESNVPEGRGWSPLAWQILEGKNSIAVSLLEAADKVDSGPVWAKRELRLEGHELHDEINAKLFALKIELMEYAIANLAQVIPTQQGEATPTYYRKRCPDDSRIDPSRTIAEQFNLLRVADPERYPAFFDWCGHRYQITLTKLKKL